MSRFIRFPSDEDEDSAYIFNVDAVKTVLWDAKMVYVTFKGRDSEQAAHEFETKEDAKAFIEKNFILFNA